MSLVAHQLRVRAGGRELLAVDQFRLEAGRVHAVLGANGAGKTSLLRALSGELAASRDAVTIDGRRIADLSPLELARRRAVLPQHDALRFGFRVREVVRLGRQPWSRAPARDAQVLDQVMDEADIRHLAERSYTSLSGGERRRVQFARVLAQLAGDGREHGRYLLLDEPAAHLDLAHRDRMLAVARSRARELGIGVLIVLHDPTAAARWADDATLLRAGRVLASGPADAVLTPEALSETYGVAMRMLRAGALRLFLTDCEADGALR